MAPQELIIFILHDLCAVSMFSVFVGSKSAYLVFFLKPTDLETEEKML